MKYLLPILFLFIIISLFLTPTYSLGYLGIVLCFLLCSLGTSLGIWSIACNVSGVSIKHPRVGTKSILGTVVCEANFLTGIITCVLNYNTLKSVDIDTRSQYLLFSSSIFVGLCSLYSSLSTGIICSVITLMDGKDSEIFFKIVVLEVIPASVGLIGFILGIVMTSKI